MIVTMGVFVYYNLFLSAEYQFSPNRDKVIIIPIEFNDLTFSNFDMDLNSFTSKLVCGEDDTYSVVDYYKEASFGKLNLRFEVIYLDDNGTLSPFRVNNNYTYYSSDSSNPQNSSDPSIYADAKGSQLMSDALRMISQLIKSNSSELKGLNFLPDHNTTIILLHPSQPQETTKNSTDFWSKASNNAKFGDFGLVSVVLLSFNSSSGTIIHELGHSFGLVDLYDVDDAFKWYFSPMAISQDLPNTSDFLAMEKIWLGWINSSEILTINKGDRINNTYLYPSNWNYSIANKTVKIIINESAYYILELKGNGQYWHHFFMYLIDESRLDHANCERILGKDIIRFFYSVYLPSHGLGREYYDSERMISFTESPEAVYFHDNENGINITISYRDNCAFIDDLNYD